MCGHPGAVGGGQLLPARAPNVAGSGENRREDEVHDRDDEIAAERRRVQKALGAEVLLGEQARPGQQRSQREPELRVDVEQSLDELVQEMAERQRSVTVLAAATAIAICERGTAIGAVGRTGGRVVHCCAPMYQGAWQAVYQASPARPMMAAQLPHEIWRGPESPPERPRP